MIAGGPQQFNSRLNSSYSTRNSERDGPMDEGGVRPVRGRRDVTRPGCAVMTY